MPDRPTQLVEKEPGRFRQPVDLKRGERRSFAQIYFTDGRPELSQLDSCVSLYESIKSAGQHMDAELADDDGGCVCVRDFGGFTIIAV